MPKITISCRKGVRTLIAALTCSLISTCLALELGSTSLLFEPAQRLSMSIGESATPIAFRAFALAVGGVALTKTAHSTDGSEIIDMHYNAGQPDGSRLVVTVKEPSGLLIHPAVPTIYDWQLVPLARYVGSDTEAAVTLFGSLLDPEKDRALKEEGAMIANYHPALENTLLGLRLLQADMLAFVPDATDLFKANGQYILGKGEKAPTREDLRANVSRFKAIDAWRSKQPIDFQSYVTGDMDSQITYSVTSTGLGLVGVPSWHCWRRDMAKESAISEKAAASELGFWPYVIFELGALDDARQRAMRAELRHLGKPGVSPIGRLEEADQNAAQVFARRVVAKVQALGSQATANTKQVAAKLSAALSAKDMDSLNTTIQGINDVLEDMEKNHPDELKAKIAPLEAFEKKNQELMSSVPLVQMNKASESLTRLIAQQNGVNPHVYATLTVAVRFAALFRAFKARNPDAYQTFLAEMRSASVTVDSPKGYALVTPTVYPRN